MKKREIICIIMGGGRGSRLHPLTKERCKPAVPFGGKYRLVDIPISNCLNSGCNRIYVLTQFNTASLHRHIQESYKFDSFGGGCVEILSAEQTDSSDSWYQGTADAVRQNMHHFGNRRDDALYLILSGDQLYHMDLADMIRMHDASGASLTIAAKPVELNASKGLGLMRVNDNLEIEEFVEKPTDPAIIKSLAVGDSIRSRMKNPGDQDYCMASMGIYVFNANTLTRALDTNATDFGKEIIPELLGKAKMCSYIFDDYWEDVGTIRAFFDTNLRLTEELPPFDFFNQDAKIYTRGRLLPPSKLNSCQVERVVIGDGSIITNGRLKRCLLGVRSVVQSNAVLEDVVMLGADYYDTIEDLEENHKLGRPALGIGSGSVIKHAILDKNVRIGQNVVLDPKGLPDNLDEGNGVFICDGVLVVGKDTIVPDGFVLKA
ncbi:MAG: glucose-1-phosphate adenylyltransferase [Lentimonas sp.]|jgi:glucose-1-phosphate adenylyltransferase